MYGVPNDEAGYDSASNEREICPNGLGRTPVWRGKAAGKNAVLNSGYDEGDTADDRIAERVHQEATITKQRQETSALSRPFISSWVLHGRLLRRPCGINLRDEKHGQREAHCDGL